MMHILIVHARVKAEFIEAFKKATTINAASSATEAGVARFDFLQQQDDPARFVLYEVYRDVAAAAKHKETPHYNTWLETVGNMFEEPRTRAFYTNVFPVDGSGTH
jgi:autoinducer 2-degrading protein